MEELKEGELIYCQARVQVPNPLSQQAQNLTLRSDQV